MEELTETTTKKNNTKALFITGAIIFLVFLVTLIIIKVNVESFKLGYFFLFLGLGFLFFGGVIFGFWFFFKNKESVIDKKVEEVLKLPQPITFGECEDLVNTIFLSKTYANHLGQPIKQGVEGVGTAIKSNVYYHVAYGRILENGKKNKYAIIINMHEPNLKRKILTNPTDSQLWREINRLASFPEDTPDTEITTIENPMTGIKSTSQKVSHKKDKKIEVPKKEDLEE